MYDRNYALTKRLAGARVSDAMTRVRDSLARQGFGVLTEIDVRATLKNKLGIDRKPYVILGACNPSLAHEALSADPAIGVFLPCNVDVFEGEDGDTYVQAVRPTVLFGVMDNPKLEPIAREVETRLSRVLDEL